MTDELGYLRGLLSSIEDRARTQGCAWLGSVRPGLTTEQIAAAMAPTGLRLPPEAELLFSWYDGVDDNPSPHARRFLPPFEFFPLEERIHWYLNDWLPRVAEIADSAEEPREDYWPAHYFPILDTGDRFNAAAVMVRCTSPDQSGPRDLLWSRPVLLSGIESAADAPRQKSMISLLETWIGWLDDGTVRWDRARATWDVRDGARHRHTWASAFG